MNDAPKTIQRHMYEVCLGIEGLGCSPEHTRVSVLASDLATRLQAMFGNDVSENLPPANVGVVDLIQRGCSQGWSINYQVLTKVHEAASKYPCGEGMSLEAIESVVRGMADLNLAKLEPACTGVVERTVVDGVGSC